MRDIDKCGAGVTAEEAARLIIRPILKRAAGAVDRVKDELKEGVLDKVGEAGRDFMDKTKKLFKSSD